MSTSTFKRRKYIMHSAHPSIGVSISHAARRFECPVVRPRRVFALTCPRDICLAAKLHAYLTDYFGDDFAIDWNCLSIKARGKPQTELNPHEMDCLILFGHSAEMDAKTLDQIYDYWQCGGSILALRISDFSLHGASQFAGDVFGGEYQYEHSLSPVRVTLPMHGGYHPLLRGIQPFVSRGGLHRYDYLPIDATPLVFGSSGEEDIPVAWIRTKLGRRVFATTLGSPADFRHPLFLRLLANAIAWTSR
jgi:hypothetical protein